MPLRNRPECGVLCAAPCCPPNHRYRTCLLSQPPKMRCRTTSTVNSLLEAHNTAISLEWYSKGKRVGAIHLSQLCAGSGCVPKFKPTGTSDKPVEELFNESSPKHQPKKTTMLPALFSGWTSPYRPPHSSDNPSNVTSSWRTNDCLWERP